MFPPFPPAVVYCLSTFQDTGVSILPPVFHTIHSLLTAGRQKERAPEALRLRGFLSGRSGGIRTRGLLVPNRSPIPDKVHHPCMFLLVVHVEQVEHTALSSYIHAFGALRTTNSFLSGTNNK